jgi:sigma-B regulation protein RsbU (phosphoserine phosphatase)
MEKTTTQGLQQLTDERKFQLLLQISEKISATFDLGELLDHLIDTARSVVHCDAAGIYVIKRSGGERAIEAMVTRGYDGPDAESCLMLDIGEGVTGTVIQTGQTLIIPDVRKDDRYIEARRTTRSEIAAPISLNERIIGAFNLESDELDAFTEADADVLHFFANAAAISIEKAVLHEELVEKKRIESQLEVARQVQSSLLPDRPPEPDGFDIAAENLPTYEVGGDYYDFINFPDSQIGIAIADVSGKGVPAALIMATLRAALRTQVRNDFALPDIMRAVNHLLFESTTDAQFVTAVYGVLDPHSGRFTYSNCGHNPPLLMHADGRFDELTTGGPALGIFDVARFEQGIVDVPVGATLAFYTDGVVEAADQDGKEFGLRRLRNVLYGSSGLSAFRTTRAVLDATRSFSGTDAFADDFTLVVVKRV